MRFDRLISTIDAHAAGEPLRIITAGIPPIHGATMTDRRRWMRDNLDHLRRALLFEPRGHPDMYGAVLTPPVTPGADYGVIFLTNGGYSTMCGHGIIALTTVLIETGMFPAAGERAGIVYDSPAGPIRAEATLAGDRVTAVSFRNVPAFVMHPGVEIETSAGRLTVPVAWGGASYALVEAAALGLEVIPEHARRLTDAGMEIKRAVEATGALAHPEQELHGLYGTILTGPPREPGGDGRNVTIYAEGAVDRSPCGTGTSARLAWMHATGRIAIGQPWVHESILGTAFTGTVVGRTEAGGVPAVETQISGRGFITGFHQFLFDPDDPTAGGFLVR
ncbi:MAG: proline racemase family protein [Chloroflexota bacterium]